MPLTQTLLWNIKNSQKEKQRIPEDAVSVKPQIQFTLDLVWIFKRNRARYMVKGLETNIHN